MTTVSKEGYQTINTAWLQLIVLTEEIEGAEVGVVG